MNELQVFSNPEFGQVRSVMIEDAPWFVGTDAAKALAYNRTADAIKAHVDDEDRHLVKVGEIPTLNVPNRGAYIINESGLYSLIFSSKLPSAKRFKRWVTSEVLPALRKTGRYEVEGAKATPETELPERTLTHDDYLRAASIVASCRNERLPYVLAYLKQAGIETGEILPVEELENALAVKRQRNMYASEEEQLELMRLLNAARDAGYGDTLLARKLGATKNDVRRWRIGIVVPRAGRIPYLKSVLESLLNEE